MREPVIGHLPVDFVRHDRHMRMGGKARDERVDLGLRGHAAGRIGGRIDDQEPRPRRDQRQRLGGGKGEPVFLADRHRAPVLRR